MSKIQHGTTYRYNELGCRCAKCREAAATYWREWSLLTRRRRAEIRNAYTRAGTSYYAGGVTHGIAGYRNHQCRCDVCRAANAESCRRYRERIKARAS